MVKIWCEVKGDKWECIDSNKKVLGRWDGVHIYTKSGKTFPKTQLLKTKNVFIDAKHCHPQKSVGNMEILVCSDYEEPEHYKGLIIK